MRSLWKGNNGIKDYLRHYHFCASDNWAPSIIKSLWFAANRLFKYIFTLNEYVSYSTSTFLYSMSLSLMTCLNAVKCLVDLYLFSVCKLTQWVSDHWLVYFILISSFQFPFWRSSLILASVECNSNCKYSHCNKRF